MHNNVINNYQILKNCFSQSILFFVVMVLFGSCSEAEKEIKKEQTDFIEPEDTLLYDTINVSSNFVQPQPSTGILEQGLVDAGLVNIQEIEPSIMVDLKYSSPDNFIGLDLYGDLEHCYLQQKPADMLAEAQKILKDINPDLSLLVYDCARPLHIQQKLWDTLKMPPLIKKSYVSDPKVGSIHNYGSAVDVTIAHKDGTPIDMGTPYDYFGDLAHPAKEAEMIQKGLLTKQQIQNRKLLRQVLMKAGFTPIKYEWWHFNALSRAKAKEKYKIIE